MESFKQDSRSKKETVLRPWNIHHEFHLISNLSRIFIEFFSVAVGFEDFVIKSCECSNELPVALMWTPHEKPIQSDRTKLLHELLFLKQIKDI